MLPIESVGSLVGSRICQPDRLRPIVRLKHGIISLAQELRMGIGADYEGWNRKVSGLDAHSGMEEQVGQR
jgi:hypothetical protein